MFSLPSTEFPHVDNEENPILTLQEVAAYLRVHRSTLYRMIQRGELPVFRVGADYRITRYALDRWLTKLGEKGPPGPKARRRGA